MSDFKLPPTSVSQSLRVNPQGLQPARTEAPPVTQAPAQTSAADQIKARPIQAGQAAQNLSFVDTPAPPTQAEIKWATALEQKAAKGQMPNAADAATYHRIADQLEASQGTPRLKPADMPASARETQWALDLETRVQTGKPISAEDLTAYQNVAQRVLKADQEIPLTGSVTRPEMDWATNLQKRATTFGIRPSAQELEVYTEIYNRSQTPQPATKVSPEDLEWATQLKTRIDQGYLPTADDQQRYTQIFTASQPAQSTGAAADIEWALALKAKASKGYVPLEIELDRYGAIAARLAIQDPASIKPEDRVVSQHELDWATRLQEQAKKGIPASPEEQKRYQALHQRYQLN